MFRSATYLVVAEMTEHTDSASTHLLKQDFKVPLLFLHTIEVISFSRLDWFSFTLSSYSYGLDRPARNRELDSMILKIRKFTWIMQQLLLFYNLTPNSETSYPMGDVNVP